MWWNISNQRFYLFHILDADGTYLVSLLGPLILALAVYSNPKSLLIHLCEEKELKFKET
jgi:hypothetical protein